MMKINKQADENNPMLRMLRKQPLGEFANLIHSIENDLKEFFEDLVYSDAIVDQPDIIHKVELNDDYETLTVEDFISYHYAKKNNPINELLKVYKLLTKRFISTSGSISGKLDSITFEQVPGCPIARVNLTKKQKATIKAKNSVMEIEI